MERLSFITGRLASRDALPYIDAGDLGDGAGRDSVDLTSLILLASFGAMVYPSRSGSGESDAG